MSKNKKYKKWTKRQLRKTFNGAISILLCLVMAPFLTIALGLVEYARYQEVISMVDELYELTGISVLSDYDTYIHERFGLMATSQEQALDSNLDAYFDSNMAAIAGQATVENGAVRGINSLNDTAAFRQQVVDFSELTVTTAVLAEDFHLEELLNQIKGLSAYENMANTVSGLATVTEKLTEAVKAFEKLGSTIKFLQDAYTNAKSNARSLAQQIASLYQKLAEQGITLPSDASAEQITNAANTFATDYLPDLQSIYATANNLKSNLSTMKKQLTDLKTNTEAVIEAVKAAAKAMDSLDTTSSGTSKGEISEEAGSVMESILDGMKEIVEGTLKDIKSETVNAAKDVVDGIQDAILEESGLAGFAGKYSQIVSGSYFSLPLSNAAEEDLKEILQAAHTAYQSAGSASAVFNAVYNQLKSKFVPEINLAVDDIRTKVDGIINEAGDALKEKTEGSLWDMLSKLMNIVKSLFDLDVFYDGDLCAFVNIGSPEDSGYQTFLTEVGKLFTAIEDFGKAIKKFDVFKLLKAMGSLFRAIGNMITAIFKIAGDMLSSLKELGGAAAGLDMRTVYEKLLISGYMTHNLPSRTSAAATKSTGKGIMRSLSGTGLTGFAYDDIARPALYAGQSSNLTAVKNGTKLQNIATFINNLQAGAGSDTMFMGAEVEYIRAGTNSEVANQVICFMDIYFLRLLLNLANIFSSAEVNTIAAAANVAAWVVYILYIIAEPLIDAILLVNGGEVALLKGKCWLTPSGAVGLVTAISQVAIQNEKLQTQFNDSVKGEAEAFAEKYGGAKKDIGTDFMSMSYESYMLLILFMNVDINDQLSRLQDIIQLEATQYYTSNGGSFDMNKAYTALEISGDVTINTLIDFGTLTGGDSLIPETRLRQILSY